MRLGPRTRRINKVGLDADKIAELLQEPIESTFATIRHRKKRSKGCLSRDGMLHMMFKLGECAQKNWRRQRGFVYLVRVITVVKFRDGNEVKESDRDTA